MARWLQVRHGRARTETESTSPTPPDATRVTGGPRAKHATRRNVGQSERVGSTLGGGALLAYGARRRDPLGAAVALLGAALVHRGVTGQCMVYRSLGVDRAAGRHEGVEQQHGGSAVLDASLAERVEHSIVIDRPLEELWRYWRQLENLPTIMRHLQSVTEHDDGRSTWVARGPAGTTVEWDATIINEVPNQLIAWKSLDGADVPNAGSVRFTPVEEGTELRVVLEYDPPAGKIGTLVAGLFGENPARQVRDDLAAFKTAMDAGDETRIEREVAVPTASERGGAAFGGGTDEQPAADRSSSAPPVDASTDDDGRSDPPAA